MHVFLLNFMFAVSYFEHTTNGVIEQMELETAENDYTHEVEKTASSVEICECPSSYSGSSCQVE